MYKVTLSVLTAVALGLAGPANAGSCDSDAKAASSNRADLVDTAIGAGSFQTLTVALVAADLVDALRADGPYTVFAPTDEAFAKLPEGTLESLLLPENRDKLREILAYHVLGTELDAKHVIGSEGAETLGGEHVEFSTRGKRVFVNDAQVIQADIRTANGTIHVIDRVLLPGE